jgi:predicted ATPase
MTRNQPKAEAVRKLRPMSIDSHRPNYLMRVTLLREQVPSFDEYPFNIPAIAALDTLPLDKPVTFLIGENGSGKSTLLEAIAVAWGMNAEGGSRNVIFRTRESHSELHQHLRLARGALRQAKDHFFIRAESFYNLATAIENLGLHDGGPRYGAKSLHEQSHGESFLTMFMNRFSGAGFYVLDEPEAALSPTRQLSVLSVLHKLVGQGAQFLIATHSPILMAYPDAAIVAMTDQGPQPIAYRDTEHFRVTRQFLENPERMLKILLEPEEDE